MKSRRGFLIAAVVPLLLTAWLTSPLYDSRGDSARASSLSVAKPARTTTQEKKQIKLAVLVKGLDGKPVGGAAVTVWHDTVGPELRTSDYQGETNDQGLAEINVAATGGSVVIHVVKGDLRGDGTADLKGTRVVKVISVEPRDDGILTSVPLIYLRVHVERDTGSPLEGASVVVRESGGGPRKYTGITGRDGDATVTVRFAENIYSIEVLKEGYEPAKVGIRVENNQAGQTIAAPKIKLNRTPGITVTINVRGAGESGPVADADVDLVGPTGQFYRTTTDGQGRATLFVPEYGQFAVRISQEFYHTYNGEVLLVRAREQSVLDISLKEKPKKDAGDEFVKVAVLAGDKKNAPIVGASVRVQNRSVTTDANGQAVLATAFGDATHVVITASADGYKSQTTSVPVRRGVRYTDAAANATIILQPGEEAAPEDTPITLIVEVRDSFDNKPLQGAGVGFFEAGGAFLIGGYTDEKGEHDFRSDEAADRPLAVLRQGLKLDIQSKGYKERKGVLVSADLLKPSTTPRRFFVALEREWTELRAAVAALEGRVAAWDSNVRQIAEKAASINKLVKQTSAAEDRANVLSGQLGGGVVLGDAPTGKMSNASLCQMAGEVKKRILQYESEALDKEQAVKQLVDKAAGGAASCKTQQEAETIKRQYNAAVKLLAEIGALENKARSANEQLTRAKNELKGRLTIAEVESRVAELAALARVAEEAATTAQAEVERITALSRGVSGTQAVLTGELATLRITHGLNGAWVGLPADLKKRIEDVTARLASRNNDNLLGPNANGPALARASAEKIQNMKTDAERVLSFLKSPSQECEIGPLDAAFERIGNAMVSATVEVSAASNLGVRADECARRGACQPLLADVRALLESDKIEIAEARINQARSQNCDVSEPEKELDYWRTVRQVANLIESSLDSCRFQEALNLSQKSHRASKAGRSSPRRSRWRDAARRPSSASCNCASAPVAKWQARSR